MKILLLSLAIFVGSINACEVIWDDPGAQSGWLEGIRFYKDGTPVGTAGPLPPADCAAVNVVPCISCAYTATFFRGNEEGPQSDPFSISITIPSGGRIDLIAR